MADESDMHAPEPPPAETPDAPPFRESEHLAIEAEFARILGSPDAALSSEAAGQVFWLLPLTSAAEFLSFLGQVPSGSGLPGLQSGVEQLLRDRGLWLEPGTPGDAAV